LTPMENKTLPEILMYVLGGLGAVYALWLIVRNWYLVKKNDRRILDRRSDDRRQEKRVGPERRQEERRE